MVRIIRPRHALSLVSRSLRFATHLYGLAYTWDERRSLTRFIVLYLLVRLIPRFVPEKDTLLHLHGATYVIGVDTTEIFSLDELYYHRDYSKLDDFIPDKGWVVLDIGANVGIYSYEQALHGATVFAFEPNPDCYQRLERMISLNDPPGEIMPYPMALGASASTGILRIDAHHTTSGSITFPDGAPLTAPRVPVRALDDVLQEHRVGTIDLVKLDVEGAERDVLVGASETLTRIQRLIVEYHSWLLLEQVDAYLLERGFAKLLHSTEDTTNGIGVAYYERAAPQDA